MTSTIQSQKAHDLTPPSQSLGARLFNWGFGAILVWLLVSSYDSVKINDLAKMISKWDNTKEYLKDYLKPDFTDLFKIYVPQMWLTVEVALWGTFLSILVAVPLALLASNNIAPVWIVQPVRRIMDILRAVNEVVLATAFLVAVGFVPLAGVLALMFHNTGVLAKLFSEAVEAIEVAPVEGVRATGASRLHEVIWGVLPQVAPLWISFALYRFESNVRSSTVLGIIGIGGIGFVLFENMKAFDYAQTSAIAIVIVVAVSVIDLISAQIRKRLT